MTLPASGRGGKQQEERVQRNKEAEGERVKKKSVSQHCSPPRPQCGETFLPDGHCEVDLLFIMHHEQSKDWTVSQKISTVEDFMSSIQNLGFKLMFFIVFSVLPSNLSGTTQVSSKYS